MFTEAEETSVETATSTSAETASTEPAEGPRVYDIPEENLANLHAKLDTLQRRATRLGLPAPEVLPADPPHTDVALRGADGRPNGRFRRFHHFFIRSEAQVVLAGGWRLAAVIDHVTLDGGERLNLLRVHPAFNTQLPIAYRTAAPTCDHCHTARGRLETFVVADAAGQLKRIGRNCIALYLGGDSAKQILAAAELLREAFSACEDEEEGYGGGGGGAWRFGLLTALTATAAAIRTYGWLSKKKADEMNLNATASEVWRALTFPLRRPVREEPPPEILDVDRDQATRTLAWARAISVEVANDYLYNLRVIAGSASVTAKEMGLTASMVAAFQREEGRLAEQKRAAAARVDQHLGQPKERFGKKGTRKKPGLLPLAVRIVRTNPITTEFGVTTIVSFVTLPCRPGVTANVPAGIDGVWFASGEVAIATGEEGEWFGTVKKHQQGKYSKAAETVFSRCVFIKDESC